MRRTSRRSTRKSFPVLARAYRPLLSRLEERRLLATVTWASDVSGDWDNPAMWMGGVVPGSGDNATIPFSDITVTHSSSAADSVNSLNSQAALDLTNGSLALSTSSSISDTLTLQGATLSAAGALTVTGSMNWAAGTISGFGTLDIASGATLSINSGGSYETETLNGVVLENAGAVTVGGPLSSIFALALENGAGIDNQATGSFSMEPSFAGATGPVISITSDASATYFTNEGSLTQPAATANGSTVIKPAFTQTASGTTSVQEGYIDWSDGGTVSGSITGAAGTEVSFEGPSFTFSPSSSIDTAGGVALAAATVTVAGAYDVATSTQIAGEFVGTVATFTAPISDLGSDLENGGTLNLPGQSFSVATLENSGTINGGGGASLTVTGSMTWTGGTITGFGSLDIPGGATLAHRIRRPVLHRDTGRGDSR